ncbi:MAG: fibronectin type III domain-containing protein [Schleiferilactobacillus perolens]|uniref:fibronectin type III domain-containing protein n=1 Tax=Schleiferilactobacillus perolens TaxID=100468 RepID=UPI0039ED07DC
MADEDRSNQYLKVTDKSGKLLAVGDKGTKKAVLTGIDGGTRYAEGDLKAVFDTDGDNALSPEASDPADVPAVMALNVPGAPAIKLTAKDGAIDYEITAPEDDGAPSSGSSDITEYDLYLKARSDNWPDEPTQTLTPDKLTGTLDQLANGTEYTVGVIAVNLVGRSDLQATGASDHATPVAPTTTTTTTVAPTTTTTTTTVKP